MINNVLSLKVSKLRQEATSATAAAAVREVIITVGRAGDEVKLTVLREDNFENIKLILGEV